MLDSTLSKVVFAILVFIIIILIGYIIVSQLKRGASKKAGNPPKKAVKKREIEEPEEVDFDEIKDNKSKALSKYKNRPDDKAVQEGLRPIEQPQTDIEDDVEHVEEQKRSEKEKVEDTYEKNKDMEWKAVQDQAFKDNERNLNKAKMSRKAGMI